MKFDFHKSIANLPYSSVRSIYCHNPEYFMCGILFIYCYDTFAFDNIDTAYVASVTITSLTKASTV